MNWQDDELARFSRGLRRRYPVWYEQEARETRANAIGRVVCAAVVAFWVLWILVLR